MARLSREELHTLAAAGVAAKVQDIERQLAAFHEEWPELFVSKTPPQLLAITTKASSNGHWPPVVAASRNGHQARRRPALRGKAQRVADVLAKYPDGTDIDVIHAAVKGVGRPMLHSTLARFVKTGRARRLREGVYAPVAVEGAPAPAPAEESARRRFVWTPEMRAAAAKRMRERHRNGTIARALRAKKRGKH